MSDPVSEITKEVTGIWWIAYIVFGALAIIGLANFAEALQKLHKFVSDIVSHVKGKRLTDAELKNKAQETARSLMEMVQARQNSEPDFDFDRFQESSNVLIKHSQETNNVYYRDFAGTVANLREEFLKRNIKDHELDQFYEHPTNYIGLRIVAIRLAAMAEKLRG
ncbi:MAG: hypothetical protein AB1510_10850 [Bacillota bacterium]